MTLDQCMKANRPLTFVVAESDTEVLRTISNISANYPGSEYYVYSTTIASVVPLKSLLEPGRARQALAKSTLEVLDTILTEGNKVKNQFTTYICLGAELFINDTQTVRKIQDILLRYQMDEAFTVNLIMVSQKVCVPIQLERLSELVNFDLPDDAQLKTLSDSLTVKLKLKGDSAPSEEVVNNLKGMTLFEVEQAFVQSYALYKRVDLAFIRDFKKTIISKTDLLSLMETDVTFNDIGGMDRLKKWLIKSAGGWTIQGKKFGLPLLKGILLVGLSGCGKSLICKAVGNQWGLPVVDFDPARVFSSRVGDSESNMRRVLQIVEGMAPCILLVDEIEKGLAGLQSSSYSDSGVTARVIRSFLVWMQDNRKSVFVVATANNINQMPPELISRFDQTFFVNLPQRNERKDIFRIHLSKLRPEIDIAAKFDLDLLAERSQDLSGREIEQVLKDSMYDAFYAGVDISTEIITKSMSMKPSLLTTMAEPMKALLNWVGWDAEKKDGLRARFANEPEPADITRVRSEIDNLLKDIEGSGNVGGPTSSGPTGPGSSPCF